MSFFVLKFHVILRVIQRFVSHVVGVTTCSVRNFYEYFVREKISRFAVLGGYDDYEFAFSQSVRKRNYTAIDFIRGKLHSFWIDFTRKKENSIADTYNRRLRRLRKAVFCVWLAANVSSTRDRTIIHPRVWTISRILVCVAITDRTLNNIPTIKHILKQLCFQGLLQTRTRA